MCIRSEKCKYLSTSKAKLFIIEILMILFFFIATLNGTVFFRGSDEMVHA